VAVRVEGLVFCAAAVGGEGVLEALDWDVAALELVRALFGVVAAVLGGNADGVAGAAVVPVSPRRISDT
jgi:hypothetical protein